MLRALTFLMIFSALTLAVGCQKGTEIPSVTAPAPATSIGNRPQSSMDQAAMLEVAAKGDTAGVKSWLERGVDVNMRGADRNTPIMEAAYGGHLETVKLLLDHGADLSAKKNDGATVVGLAGGHREIEELFANVSQLVAAAAKGDNKTLTQLIDKGTPVNGLDQNGQSALSEAAWNGHLETVKLLLDRGANASIKKADGETPSNLARAQKHLEVVKLLDEALAKKSAGRATDGK